MYQHLINLNVEFNTIKIIKAKQNCDKDGKALYKLIKNATQRKTMEKLRNMFDVKLVSNKNYYLKWASKLYVITLTLNNPADIGMCILELSKVLMHEFHHDYIKKLVTTQNSYSQTLIV